MLRNFFKNGNRNYKTNYHILPPPPFFHASISINIGWAAKWLDDDIMPKNIQICVSQQAQTCKQKKEAKTNTLVVWDLNS